MRKKFRAAVIGMALVCTPLTGVGLASAQTPPAGESPPMHDRIVEQLRKLANAPVNVVPLRGGAYWVPSATGSTNGGFIIGDKGVIVIDAQMFKPTIDKMLAEIAKITPNPVTTIILTHSDPDHINGLPFWPRGVEVISTTETKAQIERMLVNPKVNGELLPTPEIRDYVPRLAITGKRRIVRNGVTIELLHIAPAHTDGDLVIYLPQQKIVYAGDLTPLGPYPGIHTFKGGSLAGWIATMKAMLALDADTYIPGHNDILSKAELQRRLDATIARRAEIKAMIEKGMTLEQVKAALHDPAPSGEGAMFPGFTENTYEELKAPSERAKIKSMIAKGMTLEQIKAAVHERAPIGLERQFPSFVERTYRQLTARNGSR
ncbi:hypothetical protein C1T17_06480 [Sphingobium sp. SCG-1]|uniref:MBL fold metallo-hydrolase n=1 Tax=Sphingobium sp. SCG-1 TaxID=2072936 RepID=UPI000CD6ADF8|nr:MBL fold metallo-hydrolase [Sphingobium sp. SCG-1]AUW57805.1 hypothetical protein C1T17_06480 [Sphingobium sp. SCG-1]